MSIYSLPILAQVRTFSPAGPKPEVAGPTGDIATIAGFEAIFNNVVSVALGFAGIAFFFMLVVNGFAFMTAGGEPPKIQAAKKGLTTAFIGFIAVLLAFTVIVLFESFTGLTGGLQFFKIIGP